jgi:hypothetical protein
MIITVLGVIHGRIVELTEDPGVADGQQVEVTIKTVASSNKWGEGLRRCAGAFAADWADEDDQILEEIYQDRKIAMESAVVGSAVRTPSPHD